MVALVGVCLWGGAGRAALAGTLGDYLGHQVAEVRLQSEGAEVRDPALVGLVQTLVGAPLEMAQVRETIAHLSNLGRYEDIRVDASLRGGEVVLVYDLVPVHDVREIVFAGTLGLPRGDLEAAVAERYNGLPPASRAGEAARALEALYRDRGFLAAAVVPRLELSHRPDRATLVFDVRSGPRTRIGTIAIAGTPPPPGSSRSAGWASRPGSPTIGRPLPPGCPGTRRIFSSAATTRRGSTTRRSLPATSRPRT